MQSIYAKVAACALALAAAGTASVAQARGDVYFSVGTHMPGVSIGISNAPVYYPQPVYYAQPNYYYPPAPVYYGPSYYVRPAPVYYRPVVYGVTYYSGPRHHRQHRHHRHHR